VQFLSWHVRPVNVAGLAFVLLALAPLWAQIKTQDPVLHRRSYNQVDDDLDMSTRSSGRTILPLEASGAYSLGAGGSIDVELQPDRLSGFITRMGDRESDEGTPLTFFFATSRLAGQRLAFTTRQVHGVWFSFEGTIVRGSARSREQQGYYLLEGRLVMHDAAAGSAGPQRLALFRNWCRPNSDFLQPRMRGPECRPPSASLARVRLCMRTPLNKLSPAGTAESQTCPN
jgi:hypothetical protein